MTSLLGVLGMVTLAAATPAANAVRIVVGVMILAQLIVLLTRKSARADGVLLFLFIIHLVTASVLGANGILWAACAFACLIVAPGALVLSLLRREVEGNYRSGARDRSGAPVDIARILRSKRVVSRGFFGAMLAVGIPLIAFAVVFFVLCPHLGLALLALDPGLFGRTGGSGAHIAAPDFDARPALNDDEVIARFESLTSTPVSAGIRLRTTTFDTWNGKVWSGQTATPIVPHPVRDVPPAFTFDIEPGGNATPVAILPPNAIAMQATSPTHYSVWTSSSSSTAAPADLGGDKRRYLALPALSPRLSAFASEWYATSPTPTAIETRLKTEYQYDIDPGSRTAASPLESFLFEERRGHCLYFATAMAVILRANGTPTRIVSGFAGAHYNRYGEFYAVRGRDAHAWVEAYVDGRWQSFDPTPTTLEPRQENISAARDLSEALTARWSNDAFQPLKSGGSRHQTQGRLIASIVFLFVMLVGWMRFTRRPDDAGTAKKKGKITNPVVAPLTKTALTAVELYADLEHALAERNIVRPSGVPPERFAKELAEGGHPLGSEIVSLTQLYLEVRFGGRELTATEAKDFKARVGLLFHHGGGRGGGLELG